MSDVPGNVHYHWALVAATPAVLALAAAAAAALAGRARMGKCFAIIGLVPVFVLPVLLVLPDGIAWRARGVHGAGIVAIDPLAIAAGWLAACWVAWRYHPWSGLATPAGWCARIAVAAALPVVWLAPLALANEGDHDNAPAWRILRIGVAMASLASMVWWPPLFGAALQVGLSALTATGTWRPAYLLALLGMLATVVAQAWPAGTVPGP